MSQLNSLPPQHAPPQMEGASRTRLPWARKLRSLPHALIQQPVLPTQSRLHLPPSPTTRRPRPPPPSNPFCPPNLSKSRLSSKTSDVQMVRPLPDNTCQASSQCEGGSNLSRLNPPSPQDPVYCGACVWGVAGYAE